MKCLLIGDANSIWVKEYVDKILIRFGYETTLLNCNDVKAGFNDFYIRSGVRFIGEYKSAGILSKIPKIRAKYKEYCFLKSLKYEEFDMVIIIFVSPFHLKIADKFKNNANKVIPYFIGSDLLRINDKKRRYIFNTINHMSTDVVCTSNNLKEIIEPYFDVNNIHIIDFGNSQIPKIDKALMKKNIKEEFLNIDPNFFTICLGYNGNANQQHLKMIEAVNNTNFSYHNKICLILPLTYGLKSNYALEVQKALLQSNVKYVVLTEYLNSENMADLWASTDLFIHAQTTDALSSSMLEAVYSGCDVINGSWLHYKELDDWGIEISEFDDFYELTKLIEMSIDGHEKKQRKSLEIINKNTSWDSCVKKWKNFLLY